MLWFSPSQQKRGRKKRRENKMPKRAKEMFLISPSSEGQASSPRNPAAATKQPNWVKIKTGYVCSGGRNTYIIIYVRKIECNVESISPQAPSQGPLRQGGCAGMSLRSARSPFFQICNTTAVLCWPLYRDISCLIVNISFNKFPYL